MKKQIITADKKITMATVKSFIKNNSVDLYLKVESSFDGMVDCVMQEKNAAFKRVSLNDSLTNNTYGIDGAWFVGSSRDYFKFMNDGEFIGVEVSNCCGSFVIAVRIDGIHTTDAPVVKAVETGLIVIDASSNNETEETDLFEESETLPEAVQQIIEKYSNDDMNYDSCEKMLHEMNSVGYTFEYYLDAVPHSLKKMTAEEIHAHNTENGWIDINVEKPPYNKQVLVCRPNQYSGRVDVIFAYLHPALPTGRTYGRYEQKTFDDFWSFPAVALFTDVTFWKYAPKAGIKTSMKVAN